MKKTKATKALLKALLASYNSYIKNKRRLDSERSSAFFDLSTFFIIGWFYKLALLDFELIFDVKMQESEGV